MEILQDLPDVDAVFVAVGGGGLIGGIATYLKAVKPTVKVSRRPKTMQDVFAWLCNFGQNSRDLFHLFSNLVPYHHRLAEQSKRPSC